MDDTLPSHALKDDQVAQAKRTRRDAPDRNRLPWFDGRGHALALNLLSDSRTLLDGFLDQAAADGQLLPHKEAMERTFKNFFQARLMGEIDEFMEGIDDD
jgi:hypothetical protein